MPRGGHRPGAGRPIRIALHPSAESGCLEDISGVLQIDRETVVRMAVRALHRLITECGWSAVDEFEVDVGGPLAPLPSIPGAAIAAPPDPAPDPPVRLILSYAHSRNGMRYGPGLCDVPREIASDLEHADRQAERQRRTSPVLQDRGE
jgi:hypothetical protein